MVGRDPGQPRAVGRAAGARQGLRSPAEFPSCQDGCGQCRTPAHCGLWEGQNGGHTPPPAGWALFPLGLGLRAPGSAQWAPAAPLALGSPPSRPHRQAGSCPVLPSRTRLAYLPSGEVILHQRAHDLLGRLGSAEVGGDGVTQHPLSVSDPACRQSGARVSSSGCFLLVLITPQELGAPETLCP